jgi:hypothetical protein
VNEGHGTFTRCLASRHEQSAQTLRAALERLDVDTLDRWAFGVVGDQIISIAPKDLTIVHTADLENAQYQADRYPGGPKRWAKSVSLVDPIEVSVSKPGVFVLEDGHHRYLAATLSKRKLTAKIMVKGKPIEVLLQRAGKTQKSVAQIEREIDEALAARR